MPMKTRSIFEKERVCEEEEHVHDEEEQSQED